MERYRFYTDGAVYFVTFSIVQWLPIFVSEQACKIVTDRGKTGPSEDLPKGRLFISKRSPRANVERPLRPGPQKPIFIFSFIGHRDH